MIITTTIQPPAISKYIKPFNAAIIILIALITAFIVAFFINNVIIDNRTSENTSALKFDFSILSQPFSSSNSGNGQFSEHIQTIINTLIKNGYRYNIHLVLAISGDSSTYERSISGINNILLFNETDYTDQTSNSYYLKEMLHMHYIYFLTMFFYLT